MKQKLTFALLIYNNLRTEKENCCKKKDVTCDLLCKQVPTLQKNLLKVQMKSLHQFTCIYSCIQAKILKSIILLEREDNSKKK